MCSCAGGSGSGSSLPGNAPAPFVNTIPNEECILNGEILQSWKDILLCIRTNNKYADVNLTATTVNVLLGIIQSAINYPDNYCYYVNELNYFRTNILIRIIENVPTCIN